MSPGQHGGQRALEKHQGAKLCFLSRVAIWKFCAWKMPHPLWLLGSFALLQLTPAPPGCLARLAWVFQCLLTESTRAQEGPGPIQSKGGLQRRTQVWPGLGPVYRHRSHGGETRGKWTKAGRPPFPEDHTCLLCGVPGQALGHWGAALCLARGG